MYNADKQSEPEKNKIKTTFGPPLLPIKCPHKTPPLTNLRGGDPATPSGSAHDWNQPTINAILFEICEITYTVILSPITKM